MITQGEYIKQGGLLCPCCESDQLEGSEVTVEPGRAHQEMWCMTCNAMWLDTYRLVGYGDVEILEDLSHD